MSADMGGNNLIEPLSLVIDRLATYHKEVRVFLLTDGRENNPEEPIQKASKKKENTKIHTFGIGNDCDIDMVQRMAKNGRGTCSLIGDNVPGLDGLVITALARASDQSLQGCKLAFGG
jgi:hypothetical protein